MAPRRTRRRPIPLRKWLVGLVGVVGFAAALVAILDYFEIRLSTPSRYGGVLRVNYFRLGGSMAEMVIKDLLDDELGRGIGGPHDIMKNEVLEAAQEVFARFSQPVNGDLIYFFRDGATTSTPIELSEYVERVGDRTPVRRSGSLGAYLAQHREWTTYLGGSGGTSFAVPDVDALNTFLHSSHIPRRYHVYHYPAAQWQPSGSEQSTTPILWRSLTRGDLDRYDAQISEYIRQAFGDGPAGSMRNYVIEGLQWLTRERLPRNFVLITGMPAPHHGWSFTATMPDLELEVAVFENIGKEPMAFGPLEFARWKGPLRTQNASDTSLANAPTGVRRLLASDVLAPNERVIVPTRVTFLTPDQSRRGRTPFYPTSAAQPPLLEVPIGIRIENGRDAPAVVYKDPNQMNTSTLPPKGGDRFDFGPSWRLQSVAVNGRRTEIRRANWKEASLYFGSEKGSCPYIFTRRTDLDPWINQGHMLLGATSASQARTDIKALGDFSGAVTIRELEDEVTYLQSVSLIVHDSKGAIRRLAPWPPVDSPVVIGPRNEVTFHFPGYQRSEDVNAFLELTGYYRPYALLNVERLKGSPAQ